MPGRPGSQGERDPELGSWGSSEVGGLFAAAQGGGGEGEGEDCVHQSWGLCSPSVSGHCPVETLGPPVSARLVMQG